MTQMYVIEFTGTVLDKDKVPFVQHFYVVAASKELGLTRLQSDNPKVTDFVCTGHVVACNKDW